MIEERGRVVKVDAAFVWVETQRKSTCGKCSAQNTCGHGLMNRLKPSRENAYIKAANCYPVSEGDEVTVALAEQAVVSASFLVYLVPLLTMLISAMLTSGFGFGEPVVIASSLAGLASGFVLVRWWSTRSTVSEQYEPVVLHWHVPLSAVDGV